MRNNYAVLFGLLNKRLFKKPSFVIILCMIPLLVLGLKLISKQESGIVRIALVNEGAGEKTGAGTIIDSLLNADSVFLYSRCDSEEEAVELLDLDSVDAVWVFPEDYDERVSAFTTGLVGGDEGAKNLSDIRNYAFSLYRQKTYTDYDH